MKIGILTLHSQVNYGAILQCWALQEYLRDRGFDVVVLDRWSNALHYVLVGPYLKLFSWKILFLVRRIFFQRGGFRSEIRRFKTRKFIKARLRLSAYHFSEWSDAPRRLGVDCVIVGSDQVFNYHDEPNFFLLNGAPDVKAICYAASFGTPKIPLEHIEKYKLGLARFSAISCREHEGVEICDSLGFDSIQVCDPTLLVSDKQWQRLASKYERHTDTGLRLVCYLIYEEQDLDQMAEQYGSFSREMNCTVDVFLHAYSPWRWTRRLPAFRGVKFHLSGGPGEFLASISKATWVVSNAFHGLMLSIVFGRNVRILKPIDTFRKEMFSRVKEFESYATTGTFVVKDTAEALASFRRHEFIAVDRNRLQPVLRRSYEFLEKALRG